MWLAACGSMALICARSSGFALGAGGPMSDPLLADAKRRLSVAACAVACSAGAVTLVSASPAGCACDSVSGAAVLVSTGRGLPVVRLWNAVRVTLEEPQS